MDKSELSAYVENFITCSGDGYIPSPQAYSPLYVRLYGALISGKEPGILGGRLLSELSESTIDDINYNSTNTFDRYLMACYMSPFELSYPLEITDDDLRKQKLINYLCAAYGKASSDLDSLKMDRTVKELMRCIPERYRAIFAPDYGFGESCEGEVNHYRSSLFKFVVFNYKMSRLNEKWKVHIRRASEDDKSCYHLDTVIAFNGLSSDISRQSSAIFMTLFYELDQSSPDGDLQQSRNIVTLPSALELIAQLIQRNLVQDWCDGFDSVERAHSSRDLVEFHLRRIAAEVNSINYENRHHHFCDVLKTAMLCNANHNKLLAKLEFEHAVSTNIDCVAVFDLLLIKAGWYKRTLSKVELTDLIMALKPDLKERLVDGIFEEKIWTIASTLEPVLLQRVPGITSVAAYNISVLFVLLCKQFFPRISGSLYGANQRYSLWKALKDGYLKLEGKPSCLWSYESVYRPSLLHLLEVVGLSLVWKGDAVLNSFDQFMRLRGEVLSSQIEISDLLYGEHHLTIIGVANVLMSKAGLSDEINESVSVRFWERSDPGINDLSMQIVEHQKRRILRWPDKLAMCASKP